MKISAKSLMWAIGMISAISILLQFVGLFLPSLILAIIVLVLTGVIGALAIWQWYRSDRELRQQFQQERMKTKQTVLNRHELNYESIFEAHARAKQKEQE